MAFFFFCVVNVNVSVAATAYYILALLLLLSDGGNDDEFGDPLHDDATSTVAVALGLKKKTNKTWLHGMIAVPFLASSQDIVVVDDELSIYSTAVLW